MARINNRRSRTVESEEETVSRASTPLSTAPNDRKRMRLSVEPQDASPGPSQKVRSGKVALQPQSPEEDDRKFAMQPKNKHQPGAIVRVKLTNFVTYTSAEFFPGPNLNMVIGPNGTGKSTLVCAICLGLGWGPQLLGRAKELGEFVKHGSKEATIEIELQRATIGPRKTGGNPIITRQIRKDNKTSFWLNGSSSTNKAVQELARGFNIQVDNLCQFLPQDRVVEFAQMNPVQMLETTLKAAADPEVYDYLTELRGLRAKQQEIMRYNKGDRDTLQNLEKRQEAQRSEVDRLRERQSVQKKIDQLEKCRPLPKYTESKKKASELRTEKTKLAAETAKLKQESAPALRRVNDKVAYAKAAEKNRDTHRREVRRAEGECERLDRQINIYVEAIKDCATRHTAATNSAKNDKAELPRRQRELADLNIKKGDPPEPFDTRAINEEISEHKNKARELADRISTLQSQMDSYKTNGKEMLGRKRELEQELDGLDTQEGQRESRLKNLYKETYNAWQWIRENKDSFKAEVFGPPAVTCTVKDKQMADTMEAVMQDTEMRAITAQSYDDFRTLQQKLTKDKRLFELSFRTCSETDLSSFKPPINDQELNRLGLQQWAIDCLEGPSTVLAMLCRERFLHQIAVASGHVTQEQHDEIAKIPSIKGYVADGRVFRFMRRSEYDAAGSAARVSDVRKAKVWTDQPIDVGRKGEIGKAIQQVNRDIAEIREQMDNVKAEAVELKTERDEHLNAETRLRDEKETKQRVLAAYKGLDAKIGQVKTRISRCQDNINGIKEQCMQIAKEKDIAMFQKAEAVLQYCNATHNLKDVSAKLLEAEVIFIEAQSDAETLQEINIHIRDTLRRKEAELEEASREFDVAHTRAATLLREVKAINVEAEAMAERQDDSTLVDLFNSLAADKDLTEQKLEDMLDVEHAKLELTAGGVDAANTIKEFEERAKKIDRLRNKLREFNETQSDYISGIREIRGLLEQELHPIITQIDDAFSESFSRIGCAGQVAVYKASSDDLADCTENLGGRENGLDFANWAIHISVKFRDNEPLSLLDSHRQSGGERAVSTIFYLMALQSLSKSPFRVVDEINQGMDPRNERMVHGRMVDIAAANEQAVANGNASGSQYFLITPKLLSGLKYERGMTVLCIVSGENMPSATDQKKIGEDGNEFIERGRKIDFAAFARKARQLRLSRSNNGAKGGRRVDSGVSMRVSVEA